MSIYDQEAPQGLFLNIKDLGNQVSVRFFGEPIFFQKEAEFDGKKTIQDKFATLCLYRNAKMKASEVKVYEFGWTVQKQLRNLAHDEDWGDPTGYDITIKREGEGLQTKYFITPRPKKPLSDEDKALIAADKTDLAKAVKAGEVPTGQQAPADEDSYNPFQDE